ncbi:copper homeostasis protein CutC [Stackebrandtia soli]|uniref:copper homeostasis protein CutC n=1 Tax=Stackebrandtia soli TaxID=1892856 RepID=UPI0039EC84F3
MTSPLLEIIALTADDARAATDGGADRLEVVADMASDGLTPDVATVAAIRRASALPIRVMLRTAAGFAVGDEAALSRAAAALREAGADGFVLGFLGGDGQPDTAAMTRLAEVGGLPWTCHRCVDHAVDYPAAIAAVTPLPGLDQVLTAGSPDGLRHGLASVLRVAASTPVLAGGGLTPEAVGPLRAAGVLGFHVGSAVRTSWDAPVDAERVANWRRLVDTA